MSSSGLPAAPPAAEHLGRTSQTRAVAAQRPTMPDLAWGVEEEEYRRVTCPSCSSRQPDRSILGTAVIALLLTRDPWSVLLEDHAVAVSASYAKPPGEHVGHHVHGRNCSQARGNGPCSNARGRN